jgi:histidyl-tRNA synthetase
MAKVSIPQGTRDFSAAVVRKRRFIFQTIQSIFELYGFEPLETPAMENLETLMGKYGDEGDKLIFRILNNGLERPEKHEKARADLEQVLTGKNVSSFTERALRYDLTIPFARYVAMNYGKLTLPFRRYQMQPVWRADRPQKGRYREFYQCDADIVGSSSLLNEAELANLYATVFAQLGIPVTICINNRKILAGLAEACGCPEKLTNITVAIDKLDKIGIEKVQEELALRGLNVAQIDLITAYLDIKGDAGNMLHQLQRLLPGNALVTEGIDSLRYVLKATQGTAVLQPDFTLARGLNYYTGIIFEVKAQGVQIGSIGGGGRYDDLTGLFGVPGVAGVGISFGVDRIYDVMEELQLFPKSLHTGTQVLFFNMGAEESLFALQTMMNLRKAGISCEIFHEPAKMDKQFKYAEKKGIPVAVIMGSTEIANNSCILKQLSSGKQQTMVTSELTNRLKTILA